MVQGTQQGYPTGYPTGRYPTAKAVGEKIVNCWGVVGGRFGRVLYVYSLHAICYHREWMFGLMKKLRAANSEAICCTVVDHISLELTRVFHVTTTFFFKVRF